VKLGWTPLRPLTSTRANAKQRDCPVFAGGQTCRTGWALFSDAVLFGVGFPRVGAAEAAAVVTKKHVPIAVVRAVSAVIVRRSRPLR
jgi:hypothetical protein